MTDQPETPPPPLLSAFADDPDMIELVELFVRELPDRIAAIHRALESRDLQALATLAHQLKGAAGGYGYGTITASAQMVEDLTKAETEAEEQAASVHDAVDHLVKLMNRAASVPQA